MVALCSYETVCACYLCGGDVYCAHLLDMPGKGVRFGLVVILLVLPRHDQLIRGGCREGR